MEHLASYLDKYIRLVLCVAAIGLLSAGNAFGQFGIINTVAGNGVATYAGDGLPAITASLNNPLGIWADPAGNLYIADQLNNRIRKVDAVTGLMSTIAGTGTAGSLGDGGPAVSAELNSPSGICMDAAGNIYFGDLLNNRVREINTAGIISTVAGTGTAGFSGDGGPAVSATLNHPYGVWMDAAGILLITDQGNHRVRQVDASGTITTIAGNGGASFCCDGSPATLASFTTPTGICKDAAGWVYFSTQAGDARVRKIDPSGIIHTEEGTGTTGFTGDCGPATAAEVFWPQGLGIDATGNVYLATSSDYRVREVITATGIIHTVAGSGGTVFSSDGGPPLSAGMTPYGVFIDAVGNIYISGDNRVRKVTLTINKDTVDLCHGVPVVLGSATTYADSVRWNTGAGTPSITVTTPGTYWIKQYICTYSSTDTFIVRDVTPVVNLGNDTAVCSGVTLTLGSGTYPGATYLWNDGTTAPTLAASVTGTYWLKVTEDGCSGSDTANLTFHIVPPPVVTGTTTYCQYQPYTPPSAAGTAVLWYTSPTGTGTAIVPTVNTNVPGTYNFYATQTMFGCESVQAPFTVTVNPKPVPPILADSPGFYCPQQPFVPFIVVSGSGVLWYTSAGGGIGSSSAPVINTYIPGHDTVWASQTVLGCESDRAPVAVTIYPIVTASFSLAVKYGCKVDTVMFTNSSVNATQYLWSFGDGSSSVVASPAHFYSVQGVYPVKLVAVANGCADSVTHSDSMVHPLMDRFGTDNDIICQGKSIIFTDSSAGTALHFLWNFGDDSTFNDTNAIHTYPHTGVYQAYHVITDFIPCRDTLYKTIYVDTISGIKMVLTDTVICLGTYITYTGYYASIGNTGNVWNFGDGSSIVNKEPVIHAFNAPGTYTINVTANYRACPDTNTSRQVTVMPQPQIDLGPDMQICKGSNSLVIKDSANAGNPLAHWRWGGGETGPAITVVTPGHYYATIYIGNCHASDTVWVQDDCYMNIPNVFTPNGDGINDYFYPRQLLSKGLTAFKMNIYNRWGQLVFETGAVDGRGWDGRLNGIDQPEDAYVYVIDAVFHDGEQEHHQGNVTLLR